jgi:hypothetical protein
MKRKKNDFYQKKKVLRTAFEGTDDDIDHRTGEEYHRQDERKAIEEGLEEFEELKDTFDHQLLGGE